MRNLAAGSSDESTILILCTLKWSPTQFVLQCDQWFHDGLKFFIYYLLLLERAFGWAFYPSPCLFLFALNLHWFLSTSVDKKLNAVCIFGNFSLWFKLSIFFSLVLVSLEYTIEMRKS